MKHIGIMLLSLLLAVGVREAAAQTLAASGSGSRGNCGPNTDRLNESKERLHHLE